MSELRNEDEIDGGGSAPVKPGEPRTSLGPNAVATGNKNTLELPARYLLVVTVRDRAGSPLRGAIVTVTVDDQPQKQREADATGLVDPPIEVAPQRNVVVRAYFPLYPLDAEPTPGSLELLPAERTLPVKELAERSRTLTEGSAPWWPAAKDSAGAVYLTLQPICRYKLKHLFPWQNQVLRALIYRSDPDGPIDVGRARSGGQADKSEQDLKDRKQRLRDFIRYYKPRLAAAPSISEYLKTVRPGAEQSEELKGLYEKAESAKKLQDRIRRIDLRMDWLKYKHGKGNWGKYVLGDPSKPKAPPSDDPAIAADPTEYSADQPEPQETPADTPTFDPAEDAGAGELGKDPEKPLIDISTPRNEHKGLRQLRGKLLQDARKKGFDPGKIDAAEALELSHRELLEYICEKLFPEDPYMTVVPAWVRYAVLHFSGLRYAGAHFSYQPAERIVLALRLAEIDKGQSEPTSDRQRLAILLEEHHAILRDQPELRTKRPSANARSSEAPVITNEGMEELERALAALRPSAGAPAASDAPAQGKKKTPAPAPPESVLLAAVRRCAERWIGDMDNEQQSRDALAPPSKERSAPPLPLEEAWGLLVRYRDIGRLPAAVWPAVVQYTELRNDFVNVPAIAFAKPKKPKGKEPAPPPPPPPPPVNGSQWPVMAPSPEGNVEREYKDPAVLALIARDMQAWKKQQAQNLSLVVSRAVCNQITEMLAAARGVVLTGGIAADARNDMRGERDDDDSVRQSFADTGELLARLPRNDLFRPASADQLQRGDLIFFLTWRQIGDQADPSSWLSLRLNMTYRVAVFGANDPLPGTPERKPAPPAFITLERIGSGTPSFKDPSTGYVIPHLEDLGSDMLLRGKGVRPDKAADVTGSDYRNQGAAHAGAQQLGIWRTQLGPNDPLSHVLVRRHPLVSHYSEVLAFSHIATVIEPQYNQNYLLAFETADPTGVTMRPWRAAWNVIYGRPANQGAVAHLAHYLDRANLLDAWRLPKEEDG